MPPPVEKKMNLGRDFRATRACSRFSVPIRLTRASSSGSLADTATLTWAARWKTALGATFATIPPTESSPMPASISSADGWRLAAFPVSSESMTWTRCPVSIKPVDEVAADEPGSHLSPGRCRGMRGRLPWRLNLTRHLVLSQGPR